MKKIVLSLFTLIIYINVANAQNDTMYVMKNGIVVGKYNILNEVDSVIFYQPNILAPSGDTFTDPRDSNVYRIVKVGNQIWMAENLKYLPNVIGPSTGSLTNSYYYVNGYDGTSVIEAKASVNYETYGVLYNWSAAMNGSLSSNNNPSKVQGVCPQGWHLPSDSEWEELVDYLGGESVAGAKLKEIGTEHWKSPNSEATDEIGFTALPGGVRSNDGSFYGIGTSCFWWSATEQNTDYAWGRSMNFLEDIISGDYDYSMDHGFSVRCVMD